MGAPFGCNCNWDEDLLRLGIRNLLQDVVAMQG